MANLLVDKDREIDEAVEYAKQGMLNLKACEQDIQIYKD